jgi:cell division protein FtsN
MKLQGMQSSGFFIGMVVGLLIGLALALGVAIYVNKVPIPFVNKVPQRTADQDAAEAEKNKNWDPNSALRSKAILPPSLDAAASAPASVGAATPGPAPGSVARPAAGTPTAPLPPAVAPPVAANRSLSDAPAVRGGPPGPPPIARDPAVILGDAAAPGAASAVAASRPASGPAVRSGPDPFVYFVQAGAFAQTDDAEQQRAKLAMLGFEARLSEREQSGRPMYRVRVGPFDKRDEAEAAKDKLTGAGVEANLVRVQR